MRVLDGESRLGLAFDNHAPASARAAQTPVKPTPSAVQLRWTQRTLLVCRESVWGLRAPHVSRASDAKCANRSTCCCRGQRCRCHPVGVHARTVSSSAIGIAPAVYHVLGLRAARQLPDNTCQLCPAAKGIDNVGARSTSRSCHLKYFVYRQRLYI